jgi:hypothetical protein
LNVYFGKQVSTHTGEMGGLVNNGIRDCIYALRYSFLPDVYVMSQVAHNRVRITKLELGVCVE